MKRILVSDVSQFFAINLGIAVTLQYVVAEHILNAITVDFYRDGLPAVNIDVFLF